MMRKRLIGTSLMAFIFLIGSLNISMVFVTAQDLSINPRIQWKEMTYSTSISRIWNNENHIIDYSGNYSGVNNYTCEYKDIDGNWIEEERTITHDSSYTCFSNITVTGDIVMDINLDVYHVEVSHENYIQLIWMALKEGSFTLEFNIDKYERYYYYENDYYQRRESVYVKHDKITDEILDTWNETIEDYGKWHSDSEEDIHAYMKYGYIEMNFTMPLFLTIQVYTTTGNEQIAWANLFSDFILYNDTDKDVIYSAGDTNSIQSSGFNVITSNEFSGIIRPIATDNYVYMESYVPDFPEFSENVTSYQVYPKDKSVNEMASSIVFTPPYTDSDGNVAWNIQYPNYPIMPLVYNYYWNANASYVNTSPGDFSYGFNYNISETQADLDFTVDMSKISNDSLYNAVQGLGFAIPHYTYFLSSVDMNEAITNVLTVPSDVFEFEMEGAQVAEINMAKTRKKNYKLDNYRKEGMQTEHASKGASVNKILSSANENLNDPASILNDINPFRILIFTLEDLVKDRQGFQNPSRLYSIEIQNYPIWSGEKFSHDPTLTAFFETSSQPSGPDMGIIIGMIAAIGITSIVATGIFIMIKLKGKRIT